MTWQVVQAEPDHVQHLAAILSDWIDETDWMPRLHSPSDDMAFVRNLVLTGQTVTLLDGTSPQGFLAMCDSKITALYVAREVRNRGGGKALLNSAKQSHDQLELWAFQANRDAIRFYVREGFAEYGRTPGDNPERLPDVRLGWCRSKEPTDV